MQRARRTAEIAGFPDPQVTPLLKEYDYGEYEGRTTAEIQEARPGWELFHDGCPGGETPSQVYARASEFIAMAEEHEGGNVLAFAHGHIIRTIAVAWMRIDVTIAGQMLLEVATISRLVEDARGRQLGMWNAP
jgi:broad specificity phosphatase PhoE